MSGKKNAELDASFEPVSNAVLRLVGLLGMPLLWACLSCSSTEVVGKDPNAQAAEPVFTTPSVVPPIANRPSGVQALVLRVIDGDTIEVDRALDGRATIRYIGMDTPETVAPGRPVDCFGPEATAANKRLVEGETVYLEKDISETDSFGRLLRYVYLENGEMVNDLLLRDGFAQVATYPPDVKYQTRFLEIQRQAREASLGLWSGCQATAVSATATSTPPTPAPPPIAPPPPNSTIAPPQPTATRPVATATTTAAANCHPSYSGQCLMPNASDYDCAGGGGNGPFYVTRTVRVIGPDVFDLDRDRDGTGCE